MTDINRENLSAAIDGELSKEELRFLLRRLDHDAALIEAWSSYNVASASLRRQLTPLADAGFASRVMSAIEHEKAGVASTDKSQRHWLRWSAGGAIAASVAAAALLVSQPTGGPGFTHRVPPMTAVSTTSLSPSVTTGQRLASSSGAPAAVPTWLSGYSASQLSQRASITLGDPSDRSLSKEWQGGEAGGRDDCQSQCHQ